jgi:probable rRNA maturation factor
MSAPQVEIVVEARVWEHVPDLEALTTRTIEACCAATEAEFAEGCEACVTYVDDAAIQKLNADWRKIDRPTNVLSFPTPGPTEAKLLLGDIVIAYETVAREAEEQERRFADYLVHMIVHGFLHLIGYDHETAEEAEAMEAIERRVAASLGLADPYEGTQPVAGAGSSGSDVDEE